MADEMGANIAFPADALQIGRIRDLVDGEPPDGSALNTLEDGTAVLSGTVAWGQFGELERALKDLGIAFDRHSDGKYEYSPENLYFRPGKPDRLIPATQDGEPVVALEDLKVFANAKGMIPLRKVLRDLGPPRETVAEWAVRNARRLARMAVEDAVEAGREPEEVSA